jgi:cell division septal protein FtsQ
MAGSRPATVPPMSSRLTVRKHKNRRRPGSMWSRLPRPRAIADACGRALRRSLAPAAAVVALGAIGGGLWAGHHWLTTSPRFAITSITVHGAHHVDPEDLRATLPIHVGGSVFCGLEGIARAVRDNPWVETAEVRRILPHTIAIELREHAAAAVVALDELYLVDAAGQPFKRAAVPGGEADGLPIITGISRAAYTADPAAAMATVRDALAAFDAWRATARPAIGEIHVDPHGAVTLHTYDQAIAIQLGAVSGAAAPGTLVAAAGPEAVDSHPGSHPASYPGSRLGPRLDSRLGARLRTFDAAWASLSEAERTRARAIHLDARPDHVTVAFAKD